MTSTIIIVICVLVIVLYCAKPARAAAASGVLRSAPGFRPPSPAKRLRVATYNIHGARGTDGTEDLARIAGVIRGADVVALQEVRAGWRANQAQEIARILSLDWLYTPAVRRWCRDYRGNGLLSNVPVRRWQTYLLPNVSGHRYRIYTVAEVGLDNGILSILFTHLHTREGREHQLRIVLEQFETLQTPAILIGDLNSRPDDAVLKQRLSVDRVDAIGHVLGNADATDRVDWIITRGLQINGGGTTEVGPSDHPYYWVEVSMQ